MLSNFLIFLAPFSLFSVNVLGFELYPQYLLFPLGMAAFCSALLKGGSPLVSSNALIFALFVLVVVGSALTRVYLLADLLKICVMVVTFLGMAHVARRDLSSFARTVDLSVLVLVLYGLFQYIMVLCGEEETARWLHEAIGYEGHGGPVDYRGGIMRVASLTKEPSYFAFIVGVYLFITESRWVRLACVVGLGISFSLITLYSAAGMALYRFCRLFGARATSVVPLFIVSIHFLFVLLLFDKIPDLLLPTFEDRYAGLAYLVEHGTWTDWLVGATDIDKDYPVNLVHPFSNVGSVFLLYGAVGMILYLAFLAAIQRRCRYHYGVIALFLFGINFYYLTAWPIVLIFFVFFLSFPVADAQL